MQFLNWSTPFIVLASYGLVRFFARPSDSLKKNRINWTPLESVGITLAIYFGSQILGLFIVSITPLVSGVNSNQIDKWLNNNKVGQFLLILTIEALTLIFLNWFLNRRKSSFKTIGLKRPHWIDIAYVIVGYLVYFGSFIVIISVLQEFIPALNSTQQQQTGFDGASGMQLPLVFIALVVLPPFVEEIMVRGFLYSGLKKGLPIVWAVLITSGLFATAHLQPGSGEPLLWTAALDTFILSFVLIYIKEKTGSLWACIALHMLKNFIAFLGLFVFHFV